MAAEMGTAMFIVFRVAPGVPPGLVPERYDGLWIDRPKPYLGPSTWRPSPPYAEMAATPADPPQFETRADGQMAEVWLIDFQRTVDGV